MTPSNELHVQLLAIYNANRRNAVRTLNAGMVWLAVIGVGLLGALAIGFGSATCESPLYNRVVGSGLLWVAGGVLLFLAWLARGRWEALFATTLEITTTIAKLEERLGFHVRSDVAEDTIFRGEPIAFPDRVEAARRAGTSRSFIEAGMAEPSRGRLSLLAAGRRLTLGFILLGALLAASGAAFYVLHPYLYDAQCMTDDAQPTHGFVREL